MSTQVRREVGMDNVSGAQETGRLIRAEMQDRYHLAAKGHNQVLVRAYALDEPAGGPPSVGMLGALPFREREFYRHEDNVVDWSCHSLVLFDELQLRYGSLGGSYSEYVSYHNRNDMDPTLWSYQDASAVKAVAGFSAVAKKDGVRQRKLLMQVATNYCWRPAVDRSNLGMLGGAALPAAHADAAELHFAAWDQSNAFTAARTPQWMWDWTAAPPLRALDIWSKLSVKVGRTVGRMGWVCPLYTRLAMGSSHSCTC